MTNRTKCAIINTERKKEVNKMKRKNNALSFYKLRNKKTGVTLVEQKGVKGMSIQEKVYWKDLGFEIVEIIKIDYEFYKFLKNLKKKA